MDPSSGSTGQEDFAEASDNPPFPYTSSSSPPPASGVGGGGGGGGGGGSGGGGGFAADRDADDGEAEEDFADDGPTFGGADESDD